MSEKNQTYELCGLKKSPLASTFKKELCPLTSEDCDFLYAKVEGFGKHVSIIEQWFAKADNLDRSNCILILGDKGSGRSSVANYIARQFYLAKGIDKKISLIKSVVKNHHDLEPVRDLLGELYNHLGQLLGKQFEENFGSTKKLYHQILFSPELQNEIFPYLSLFSESLPILNSHEYFPIVIADEIKTYQQINSIQEVFKSFPLIIYTTDQKEVNDVFEREKLSGNLHGFVVKLERLSSKDVHDFLSHRWTKCSAGNQPHPFDKEGIDLIFQGNQFYFKGVVTILTEIFVNYLETEKAEFGCSDISKDKMLKVLGKILSYSVIFS